MGLFLFGRSSLAEIAVRTGFTDQSHFSRWTGEFTASRSNARRARICWPRGNPGQQRFTEIYISSLGHLALPIMMDRKSFVGVGACAFSMYAENANGANKRGAPDQRDRPGAPTRGRSGLRTGADAAIIIALAIN
jgi:hypothetical protein